MNKLIVITGQTATGKTKLALDYAQKYNGELINCDSRQIYRYLDIITGKDITTNKYYVVNKNKNSSIGYYLLSDRTSSVEERRDLPAGRQETAGVKKSLAKKIWLYDIINPDQYFSSFDYQRCALFIIKKLLEEDKTPIIVGGTYLYLKHLLYGFDTENIPPNWNLRKILSKKSVKELQKILKEQDAQSFNRLNNSEKNNPQRLIRKIEIVMYYDRHPELVSGSDLSFLRKQESRFRNKFGMTYFLNKKLHIKNLKIEFIALKFKNKDSLRKTIEKRVEERLKLGAIEEIKNILKMGYTENDPGLKTIGYKQLISHLRGELSRDEAISQWISKEIQYAKRQYAFMKRDKNISWRDV
ncbi:hypothetical protein A3A46_01445 [Candidatus Roizmanbacteria bacterium RIFCSPLOWO2_01_FULL_37_13]|uniref:tRNA dimethylallyltransferase n=1 Tax=Candidatus Roizmanbacteria bacterium RIFCSPHIGHO2_02_FULL_38_11 TaxID=1802039 RepID=A0A1F7H066_9BACT|nr:MAG: hypothetical protein A3C25_01745 [Candidatus Roizmanbacteria bacterium RIFCSPHIGHO2_02_FULL_38_11]OGK34379.1 MAG: hypothetical protein A3F58_01475 [Candidatus Roizmanbacteria bacterium RIFCSPHIGHO2_12_FULL_37_9b]OGK42533.1 MAG: hypothetical protein A3A46_01445 [Candidatus Roizmanbacteria bacterium RIFCSPLOWO2_01_FULL_37_13]